MCQINDKCPGWCRGTLDLTPHSFPFLSCPGDWQILAASFRLWKASGAPTKPAQHLPCLQVDEAALRKDYGWRLFWLGFPPRQCRPADKDHSRRPPRNPRAWDRDLGRRGTQGGMIGRDRPVTQQVPKNKLKFSEPQTHNPVPSRQQR